MAEEEGKQDEDKPEFTPEGETLGYISLDQARVLAIMEPRRSRRFVVALRIGSSQQEKRDNRRTVCGRGVSFIRY